MKKKSLLIATAVTILSLFLLVGCTQSADIPNAPTPTPVSTENPSITDNPIATDLPSATDSTVHPETSIPTDIPPVEELAPTATLEPTATPTPTVIPTTTPTPTPTEIPHVHEYVNSVSVPVSCETDGETLFSCSCGDSYTEPITATGHNYVTDESIGTESF